MFYVGRQYVAALDIPLFDSDAKLQAGTRVTAVSKTELIDLGENVIVPMALQIARPEWFFNITGTFNPPPRKVPTRGEFVYEIVRAYPDLLMHELWERAIACDPTGLKPIKVDSFSSLLSKDTRIEMFKDGTKVEKVGHNMRFCTFRVAGWKPRVLPQAAE